MPSPVRLVAFDWGGVILKHHRCWADACTHAGLPVRTGHDEPEMITHRRKLNQLFQSGKLGPDEFYPAMAAAMNGLYTPQEVRQVHDAWLTEEYPGVDDLIARLASLTTVETALLSNTNPCHWARQADFPTVKLLKHRHASHLLGHTKPAPEIFTAFENATGYRGQSILFFDDLLENVAAASAAGWQAELIDHTGDTTAQISRHLSRYNVM